MKKVFLLLATFTCFNLYSQDSISEKLTELKEQVTVLANGVKDDVKNNEKIQENIKKVKVFADSIKNDKNVRIQVEKITKKVEYVKEQIEKDENYQKIKKESDSIKNTLISEFNSLINNNK